MSEKPPDIMMGMHWKDAMTRFHTQADGLYRILCEQEILQPRQFIRQPDGTLKIRPFEEYWSPQALELRKKIQELIQILKQDAFKMFLDAHPECLHEIRADDRSDTTAVP